MKIVVEVSEKDYLAFCLQFDNGVLDETVPSHRAKIAIANGTPLPKGLIQINDAMSVFDDFMCGDVDEDGMETFYEMLKERVIEADKEGAEE